MHTLHTYFRLFFKKIEANDGCIQFLYYSNGESCYAAHSYAAVGGRHTRSEFWPIIMGLDPPPLEAIKAVAVSHF